VIPVVTPEEMGAIDAAAPEPVEVLIGRAGAAVAAAAVQMLGGTYGRRVVVVAGGGNNGNDGREAARRLRHRGVRVEVFEAKDAPDRLPAADLVIDAAYGTGFRGEYTPPDPAGAPVLAVDIPSGVDGLTGQAGPDVLRAERTVSFAALKPGLVLQPGRSYAGQVDVADIGLDVAGATAHEVEAADVARWLPARPVEAHKWQQACWIVAGSPGMTGAAHLAARAAQRAGAGYVRLSTPGLDDDPMRPTEAVGVPLPAEGWQGPVAEEAERFGSLVVGPGLGRSPAVAAALQSLVVRIERPLVLDGDALTALGDRHRRMLADRTGPTVITPHAGEFERLTGSAPPADRIEAVRDLAARWDVVVLLKGSTTVVAHADGRVLLTTTGDARLATAGTGDVLSGVIGALVARGVEPFHAAAAGAFIHGRAGTLGWRTGLVAGDLVDLLPPVLAEIASDAPREP
jgi:NAD(P)H-hydrate epimerase